MVDLQGTFSWIFVTASWFELGSLGKRLLLVDVGRSNSKGLRAVASLRSEYWIVLW
jgi:hypothetical protein